MWLTEKGESKTSHQRSTLSGIWGGKNVGTPSSSSLPTAGVLCQQIEAQAQGDIDFSQFLATYGTATANQAGFFNGHYLFAFDIGEVGQAVFC
jgi:hypothetical protein